MPLFLDDWQYDKCQISKFVNKYNLSTKVLLKQNSMQPINKSVIQIIDDKIKSSIRDATISETTRLHVGKYIINFKLYILPTVISTNIEY